MSVINDVSILTGETNTTLLETLIKITTQKFKSLTNISEILADHEALITEWVVIRYNQLGSEGLQSETEGKVTKNWFNGIPPEIQKQINKYRKVKFI